MLNQCYKKKLTTTKKICPATRKFFYDTTKSILDTKICTPETKKIPTLPKYSSYVWVAGKYKMISDL
jgi:hypothetical protein